MSRKILSTALAVSLMFGLLFPLVSVSGQGLPNPDHIYYATHGGPETVDPAWAYDTASGELMQNILEPLCAFDGIKTDAFVAKLAYDWPGYDENPETRVIIPSPPRYDAPTGTVQTWYFHIRPNVEWQDSFYGYLEPSDVEYSIERGMLMDHSGGPQWMLYEPLLGGYGSSDYDLDGDDDINSTEYVTLENDIKAAVGSNATYVWFNLPGPYAPFQQILSQAWGFVLCEDYAVAHGCWNGQYGNYTEFQRCYDPPSPGPLMTPGPEAMGTGPYKLAAMSTDPHTGWYTLEKFDNYWGGWAGKHVTYATVKNVEEWANRKAQFFSTDPSMQADCCVVPRANVPEMHPGGDKDIDPYAGFSLDYVTVQIVGGLYFNYNLTLPSDYVPKIGDTDKPDLFTDRDLRLAFIHCFNVSQYIIEYWLGEAVQPTTCMPPGTAFYNASKPNRVIDLTLAEQYFQSAWGGAVWTDGITVMVTYNEGNVGRETVARMLEDVIENRISWPGTAVVDIQPTGVAWSPYLVELYSGRLPAFVLGWMADFPDPHNWFMPFMHSHGDYSGYGQHVEYGLGDITASWYSGSNYGPPPYTNALGETVSAINTTYTDHIIETAIGEVPAIREELYNELMDIFYAEACTLALYTSLGRHYTRDWVHGWVGTWNENPICPGNYWYTMYKEVVGTLTYVDVGCTDIELGSDNITEHLIGQAYHDPRSGIPWVKIDTTTAATVPIVEVDATATYFNTSGSGILVLLSWVGITESGYMVEFGYDVEPLLPTDVVPMGPRNVSNVCPDPGNYTMMVSCYVLSGYAFNVQVTPNFDASWFIAAGLGMVNEEDWEGNVDWIVDGQDYQKVKRAIYAEPGDIAPEWRWMADVNNDNLVDGSDWTRVKANIGVIYEPA